MSVESRLDEMSAAGARMKRAALFPLAAAIGLIFGWAAKIAWGVASNYPTLPALRFGQTYTGAGSSISASVWHDSYGYAPVDNLLTSASQFIPSQPIREWAMSVVAIGGVNPAWIIDLEVSNDDATFTRILRHHSGSNQSGQMVWVNAKFANRIRLNLVASSGTPYITATVFGTP